MRNKLYKVEFIDENNIVLACINQWAYRSDDARRWALTKLQILAEMGADDSINAENNYEHIRVTVCEGQ